MSKKALITGNSSGLGEGLTEMLLSQNYHVYGCSRRGCSLAGNINDIRCDLTDFAAIPKTLDQLLSGVDCLELVILNAGMLGQIKPMQDNSIAELQRLMDVNVWSNKCVLDYLLASGIKIDQIVLMSSGAAVLGNRGWGGYAISKAALNMLGRLYAHEFRHTHIAAIAPGLIESDMMAYMCAQVDSDQFPALKRIQQARKTGKVLSPLQAAERVLHALPYFKDYESGSYIDIRQILAPEEYAELMQARNVPGNN